MLISFTALIPHRHRHTHGMSVAWAVGLCGIANYNLPQWEVLILGGKDPLEGGWVGGQPNYIYIFSEIHCRISCKDVLSFILANIFLPKIHGQISFLLNIRVRLHLMPPKRWHKQHITRFQHTVDSPGICKLWKAMKIWIGDVDRWHHHRCALQEGLTKEFSCWGIEAQHSFWYMCLVQILVMMRIEKS